MLILLLMLCGVLGHPIARSCHADQVPSDAIDGLRHLFVSLPPDEGSESIEQEAVESPGSSLPIEGEDSEAPVLIRVIIPSEKTIVVSSPHGADNQRPGTLVNTPAAVPDAPLLTGFHFSNTMRIIMRPSSSTYQVSERGDLGFSVRPFKFGFLLEALKREDPQGRKPVRLQERYAEYAKSLASDDLDLRIRLGTRTNMGFGSGLVTGALNLDGLSAVYNFKERFTGVLFWGLSRDVLPDLYGDTDFESSLSSDEEQESFDLSGFHLGFDNLEDLKVGLSLIRAHEDNAPSDELHLGLNGRYDTDWLNFEGEAVYSSNGGRGAYTRMALRPHRFTSLSLALRDYRSMSNRFNLPPLYSGISGGNDTDEFGWLVSLDVAPWQKLSAGIGVDSSRRHDGSETKLDTILRLQVNPHPRFSSLFSMELEKTEKGNPRVFTTMATYRLKDGGRLSGRYSRDTDDISSVNVLQLTTQYPLLDGRLTLLAEHALRQMDGEAQNNPQVGCTLRLWTGHFITLRYSMASGAPDSISATVFSRY